MRYIPVIILLSLPFTAATQSSKLNERILDAAVCKMNTKIGNGLCWRFVHKVLQEADATISVPLNGEEIIPGDIFYTPGFYQFKGTFDSTIIEALDAHIAIVYKVLGDNRYMILNQNTRGSKKRSTVVITTIDLSEDCNTVSRGVWFFRPHEGDIFTHDLTHIYKKLTMVKG